MRSGLQPKLLELTRDAQSVTLRDLAETLNVNESALLGEVTTLHEQGLVSFAAGLVKQDPDQRMELATRLIKAGHDPQKISRWLQWQEFENFSARTLEDNGFRTVRHLVFQTRLGRREIDLVAWNDNLLLAVDCKHWLRGLSGERMRKTVRAQLERSMALAGRVDLLIKHGVKPASNRAIMPIILALADVPKGIVDGVPIVAVSKLISFLYGVSPVDHRLRIIPVAKLTDQMLLSGIQSAYTPKH